MAELAFHVADETSGAFGIGMVGSVGIVARERARDVAIRDGVFFLGSKMRQLR